MEIEIQTASQRRQGSSKLSWFFCALAFAAPFIYLGNVRQYADAPKEAFIQIGIMMICIVWALSTIIKRRRVKVPAAFVATIIFTIYAALTLAWAINPYEGFSTVLHWSICSLAILIITNIVNKDHLLYAIFLSGFVIACIGLLQQYAGLEFIPQSIIPAATMANAKHTAHYVTACLFLGLYFKRWPFTVAMALMLFYIVITGSKLSMLIIAAVFLSGVCVRLRWLATIAAVIIIATLIGAYKTPSASVRVNIYKAAVRMVIDNPCGLGVGNFKIHYPLYADKIEHPYYLTTELGVERAHSDPSQILTEVGFAGFMLLIITLIIVVKNFAWHHKRSIFVFISMLSFGLISCFSFPMYRPATVFLIMCLIGISQNENIRINTKHFANHWLGLHPRNQA